MDAMGNENNPQYKLSTSNSLPTRSFHGLPIPLLDTGFGDFEAPVHSTQPSKGSFFKVRPVVVISHL